MYSHTETRYEKLTVNLFKSVSSKLNCPDHILNIGEMTELLKEDVRSQVLSVKKDLQLRYIGVRHLISSTVIPPEVETDEAIPTTSPYFNIDSVSGIHEKA